MILHVMNRLRLYLWKKLVRTRTPEAPICSPPKRSRSNFDENIVLRVSSDSSWTSSLRSRTHVGRGTFDTLDSDSAHWLSELVAPVGWKLLATPHSTPCPVLIANEPFARISQAPGNYRARFNGSDSETGLGCGSCGISAI